MGSMPGEHATTAQYPPNCWLHRSCCTKRRQLRRADCGCILGIFLGRSDRQNVQEIQNTRYAFTEHYIKSSENRRIIFHSLTETHSMQNWIRNHNPTCDCPASFPRPIVLRKVVNGPPMFLCFHITSSFSLMMKNLRQH